MIAIYDEIEIAPEALEIANAYLRFTDLQVVANQLNISPAIVSATLEKAPVKRYVDSVFLNQGYRNRFKLAETLDEMIEAKLEEARESEMYSKKDLLEILALAHKIQMDHAKTDSSPKVQTNVQINTGQEFGEGNYGKLMEAIVNGPADRSETT